MPSYRVTLAVGRLRPGVAAHTVLPAAAAAGRDLTTVEACDVSVVAGRALVTVRFLADDARSALQVADHVCATTGALADLGEISLTRRTGSRWTRV